LKAAKTAIPFVGGLGGLLQSEIRNANGANLMNNERRLVKLTEVKE